MKKHLVSGMAMLLVLAIALPAFALDVKFGGLFRARWNSNNNTVDGIDTDEFPGTFSTFDDNENYAEQRIRFYMNFIASENLKMVLAFEQDTLWGDNRREVLLVNPNTGNPGLSSKVLTGHRDTVGLELKNAYVDFAIPCTPSRAKIGLQPIALESGWIVDEDFTGALVVTDLSPVKVTVGYISENQTDVTAGSDNVDDFVLAVNYAQGPLSADLNLVYQNAHNQETAVGSYGTFYFEDAAGFDHFVRTYAARTPGYNYLGLYGNEDQLFDLGLSMTYKLDWMNATLNYVQNLGSVEDVLAVGDSHDYRGFMIEAITNFYSGPFTFTLGGFYTSGQDLKNGNDDDDVNAFAYPIGASHYWSEIMGLGTLNDETINDAGSARARGYHNSNGMYGTGDLPSNLWTINAGAAWQALPKTKLTLNYYYIGTSEEVVTGFDDDGEAQWGNDVGHEFDMYVDQEIVDKLMLRLVAAYLVAGDAFTVMNVDDDAWELGARLQWSF